MSPLFRKTSLTPERGGGTSDTVHKNCAPNSGWLPWSVIIIAQFKLHINVNQKGEFWCKSMFSRCWSHFGRQGGTQALILGHKSCFNHQMVAKVSKRICNGIKSFLKECSPSLHQLTFLIAIEYHSITDGIKVDIKVTHQLLHTLGAAHESR